MLRESMKVPPLALIASDEAPKVGEKKEVPSAAATVRMARMHAEIAAHAHL
jgi:hypothetical protein